MCTPASSTQNVLGSQPKAWRSPHDDESPLLGAASAQVSVSARAAPGATAVAVAAAAVAVLLACPKRRSQTSLCTSGAWLVPLMHGPLPWSTASMLHAGHRVPPHSGHSAHSPCPGFWDLDASAPPPLVVIALLVRRLPLLLILVPHPLIVLLHAKAEHFPAAGLCRWS